MKLKPIAPNQTEVTLGDGTVVLFSYGTPVAAHYPTSKRAVPTSFIRTSKKWSVTTSRHINKWIGDSRSTMVDQSVLDRMGAAA